LLEDIRLRRTVRQCEDYRCYFLVMHPGSHGMDYTGPVRAPIK
jgi:endonuclease IV